MKLNTKKTEGEKQKELKKAEQSFKKSMQCALICSSGAGEKITEHFIGCPYFVATEKPMDKWGLPLDRFASYYVPTKKGRKLLFELIKDLLKEEREKEESRWLNQTANEHDNKIKAEYKQKLIKRIRKMKKNDGIMSKYWNQGKKFALYEVEAVIKEV
jgi:hypothetical protein